MFKLFGRKKREEAPTQPEEIVLAADWVEKVLEEPPKPTLAQDIETGADWIAKALRESGYMADFTMESLREVDRFLDDVIDDERHAPRPGSVMARKTGMKIFALASYIGNVMLKEYGGEWSTDDNAPQGEVNIEVRLSSGVRLFPVHRVMKRIQNGKEDAIYPYARVASGAEGVKLAMDDCDNTSENAEYAVQLLAAYKSRVPAIIQHLLADNGFCTCYPGNTAASLMMALGTPTVRILKGHNGMLSYVEHKLDDTHIIDIEFSGVFEELFEVSIDG